MPSSGNHQHDEWMIGWLTTECLPCGCQSHRSPIRYRIMWESSKAVAMNSDVILRLNKHTKRVNSSFLLATVRHECAVVPLRGMWIVWNSTTQLLTSMVSAEGHCIVCAANIDKPIGSCLNCDLSRFGALWFKIDLSLTDSLSINIINVRARIRFSFRGERDDFIKFMFLIRRNRRNSRM